MLLTAQDLSELTDWRRELHRWPELSGQEVETARKVEATLAASGPDRIVATLGGHGVAALYEGAGPGPTVMLRAELDGLPIDEIGDVSYRSAVPGRGHLCGHDGHMATLMAVARVLRRERPRRGRAVLLFQPAEENGAGAVAVLADPRFAEIAPDWAFALHNLPGLALGQVALAEGPVNCASRGMRIALTGRTAHASMPEHGISPMTAMASVMPELTALGSGGTLTKHYRLVTITHAWMGAPAFGIAPGQAEVWATLRTLTDAGMAGLCGEAERLARDTAAGAGLGVEIEYADIFVHCENDPEAVAQLCRALGAEGIPVGAGELPMRASEDFGRFGKVARPAMFFLGAGEDHPSLHNPDYDFPDELIEIGARVFVRTLRQLLG
ncbi:MAG: amidohydrolase [Geminicoccaceae bacterium]